MVARVRIRVRPTFRVVAKVLGELAEDLKDFKPAWRKVAPDLIVGIKQNIKTKGGAIGVSWPALDPIYRSRRGGGQALILSAKLFASIRKLTLGKKRISVGTDVDYAFFHEFGKRRGAPGKVRASPRREFMSFQDRMIEGTFDEVVTHAEDLLLKATRNMV